MAGREARRVRQETPLQLLAPAQAGGRVEPQYVPARAEAERMRRLDTALGSCFRRSKSELMRPCGGFSPDKREACRASRVPLDRLFLAE